MWPAASVIGLYFSNPEARYFAVDQITRDQVEDYSKRKGWPMSTAERLLARMALNRRKDIFEKGLVGVDMK